MSLIERFTQLENHLQGLNQKYRLLQQENLALQEKNTLAKKKIEEILGQLTKAEANHE
ncbi:MAG: hypothetical protein WC756_10300 [Taibaiella sp.]|jgi:hypothetical protein